MFYNNISKKNDDHIMCPDVLFKKRRSGNIILNSNKNNINVALIGKIISEKGIHFDSFLDMKNIKKFDHFS